MAQRDPSNPLIFRVRYTADGMAALSQAGSEMLGLPNGVSVFTRAGEIMREQREAAFAVSHEAEVLRQHRMSPRLEWNEDELTMTFADERQAAQFLILAGF